MSRKTLKDFLRINYSPNPPKMISLSPNMDGDGILNRDNYIDRGDDLGEDPYSNAALLAFDDNELGLLGDYVEYITKHNLYGNRYPIDGGNTKLDAAHDRGESIVYGEKNGAEGTFSDEQMHGDEFMADSLTYSNSGKTDMDGNLLKKTIDKTGKRKKKDGHRLFKSLNKTVGETSLDKTGDPNIGREPADDADAEQNRHLAVKTNEMLQRYNRFAPAADRSFISRGSRNETASRSNNKTHAHAQSSFGENREDGTKFKFKNLEKIGSQIIRSAAADADFLPWDENNEELKASKLAAKNAGKSPDKQSERGAFSASDNQVISRNLNSDQYPWITKHDGTGRFDENLYGEIVGKIKTLIDAKLDTDDKERENKSVYTQYNYSDSVTMALSTCFAEDNWSLDKQFFANISKHILSIPDLDRRAEKLEKLMDILAVAGDVMLTLEIHKDNVKTSGGNKLTSTWDVDNLTEGPATRISMSKTNSGPNSKSLAWRGMALPAVYHLPASALKSVQTMGQTGKNNPVKGMLAGGMGEKTFMAMDVLAEIKDVINGDDGWGAFISDTSGRQKIPKALVEEIENRLEAEYVPFYFHDLRTNEIISFHAFIDDLTDGFDASYEKSSGFGRMDPVYTYQNTTRDIGFTFKVVATSEQDFNEMWFKINKLTTMLYPQWTVGDRISAGENDSAFIRPFSQVPAGSPMIRLRIGDVIKSNYSRFNLSRIFGSGAPGTVISPLDVRGTSLLSFLDEIIPPLVGDYRVNSGLQKIQIELSDLMLKVFLLLLGSPLQFVDLIEFAGDKADDALKFTAGIGGILSDAANGLLFQMLGSGFISPLVSKATNRLRNPDGPGIKGGNAFDTGAQVGDRVLLKPTMGNFYYSPAGKTFKTDDDDDGLNWLGNPKKEINDISKGNNASNTKKSITKIMIDRHLKCVVIGKKPKGGKTYFNVVAIESSFGMYNDSSALKGRMFTVTQDDFVVDPDHMFDNYFGWFLDPMSTLVDKLQDMLDMAASSAGIPTDNINIFTTSFEDFMHPVNNSITKAFETSNGRGLAGFISSMSFSLIDSDNITWETSYGSRAPKMLDIKMKFLPVHDISPGLDSDGFTRAPTHNVGSIMNNISDDPYGGGFDKGMRSFTTAAEQAIKDFEQSPKSVTALNTDNNPIEGE